MQSRLALSKDSAAGFDPLEFDRFTRVQELTRMMAESVNDVATVQRNLQRAMEGAEDDLIAQGRQARELQRDLLRTRMVEFEGIAERLYAVVRQASKETGKQIKLDITGGSIEMDRGVLDRMTPAFEHLLRNCTRARVQADVQRIINLYRRQGHFAAPVEPKIINLDKNRVDLVFEINEGPTTGVRAINFIGNVVFRDLSELDRHHADQRPEVPQYPPIITIPTASISIGSCFGGFISPAVMPMSASSRPPQISSATAAASSSPSPSRKASDTASATIISSPRCPPSMSTISAVHAR